MTIGQIIALAVGLFLAIATALGHSTLMIVSWCAVVLAVAIIFSGKAAS